MRIIIKCILVELGESLCLSLSLSKKIAGLRYKDLHSWVI
jgi:hypothetical protein